jgi:hypothetical protein
MITNLQCCGLKYIINKAPHGKLYNKILIFNNIRVAKRGGPVRPALLPTFFTGRAMVFRFDVLSWTAPLKKQGGAKRVGPLTFFYFVFSYR